MSSYLKIVVVGEKGVGKRSLTSYWGSSSRTSNFYIPQDLHDFRVQSTSGRTHNVVVFDSLILDEMLVVNDPAFVQNSNWDALNNAHAIIFCYDLNDPQSLSGLAFWYKMLGVHLSGSTHLFLVGTKADLEIKVTNKDLEEVQKRANFAKMFEVSSKKGTTLRNMFTQIVDHLEENLKFRKEPLSLSSSTISKRQDIHVKTDQGDYVITDGTFVKMPGLMESSKKVNNNLQKRSGDNSVDLLD